MGLVSSAAKANQQKSAPSSPTPTPPPEAKAPSSESKPAPERSDSAGATAECRKHATSLLKMKVPAEDVVKALTARFVGLGVVAVAEIVSEVEALSAGKAPAETPKATETARGPAVNPPDTADLEAKAARATEAEARAAQAEETKPRGRPPGSKNRDKNDALTAKNDAISGAVEGVAGGELAAASRALLAIANNEDALPGDRIAAFSAVVDSLARLCR
jgi:hypothetical protein